MLNEKLKKRLIQKRQNVKNKLKLLRQGQVLQEDLFNPITKHLKNIEYKLDGSQNISSNLEPEQFLSQNSQREIISNKKEEGREEVEDDNETSDLKKSIINDINFEDEEIEEEEEIDNSQSKVPMNESQRFEDIAKQSFVDYLEQYDPLPRKYVRGMYTDNENKEYDHKYGIRLDTETEKLMIGDSQIHIVGSDLFIKNKRYKGTQGLYELLFKKYPINFTQQDQQNYKNIVSKTNANRRYYRSDRQIDGSKLEKYKKIIAPIVQGKGMFMEVDTNDTKIDYIHWDDPNELVDRLRLLLASQSAGHTGHKNEINSIIEELREARIIE